MANRMHTPKRRKSWSAIPSQVTNLTAASTTIVSGALPFTQLGDTVLRCQLDVLLQFTPGATFAVGDTVFLTCGLGIVTSDAFSAGSGSMPDPAGEAGFPWLYWRQICLQTGEGTSVISRSGTQIYRGRWDTKAMRKMTTGSSLVWICQYDDVIGAPDVTVNFGITRVLLALP